MLLSTTGFWLCVYLPTVEHSSSPETNNLRKHCASPLLIFSTFIAQWPTYRAIIPLRLPPCGRTYGHYFPTALFNCLCTLRASNRGNSLTLHGFYWLQADKVLTLKKIPQKGENIGYILLFFMISCATPLATC